MTKETSSSLPVLFFGIILILILIWVVAIPPFQNADEGAHYIKACANPIVETHPRRGFGHYFDDGMVELNDLADVQPIKKGESKFSFQKFFAQPIYESEGRPFYPHAVPNTLIPYLLPFLTCKAIQAVGAQYQYLFYALRLSFALSFAILLWYAKKISNDTFLACTPILALPMIINQAAALSADYFSIAAALIFGMAVSRMNHSSTQSRWTISLALFLLLNTKIVYIPFAAVLLIPCIKWEEYRNIDFWLPSAFFSAVALALQYYYQTSKSYLERVTDSKNVQLQKLIDHPQEVIDMFLKSTMDFWEFYLKGMIGFAGWLTTPISTPLMILAVVILVIWFSLGIKKMVPIDKWTAATLTIGVLMSIVCFLGIFLSMYLYWTHTDAPQIDGVQGRYFIPILIFLGALIFGHVRERPGNLMTATAFFSMCAVTIIFLIQSIIPAFH